ncbi:MAG: class I SAM-dependent methyltransferase [Bacteroidetes bacterium]|nr:class I SAM-dependent methyltransferase [Bacteroidota bacterium]
MLNQLKKIYKREQFAPKFIGLFTNPFYFARKGLNKNVVALAKNLKGKLLDVGCGSKPYEGACNVDDYIGVEIENEANRNNPKVDYFYDGRTLPFEDKRFDSIITNQVFEHVFNPHAFLKEINRVTKIGGLMLMTVPFVWDEHEQPFDYARYSFFGLRHILAEEGFETVEQRKSNNGITVIFQLLNAYIYKITLTKYVFLNLLFTLILMAPINILGLIFSVILPKNNDLYLDNIILAKKVKDV